MSRQRTLEAISASEYATIGELVRLTNVRYSTLKFYTEEGMLPFAPIQLLPSLIFDAPDGKIRKTTDFCRQPDSLSELPQKIYVIVVR